MLILTALVNINYFAVQVVVVFLLCWYLFLLQFSDRLPAFMQITLRGAERQFCVHDLSGPTAGERSVSAPGHQSGFVNFLHTASQLLSPQTLTSHVWIIKRYRKWSFCILKTCCFYLLNLNIKCFTELFIIHSKCDFLVKTTARLQTLFGSNYNTFEVFSVSKDEYRDYIISRAPCCLLCGPN